MMCNFVGLILFILASTACVDEVDRGLKSIKAVDLRRHQVFLSSDQMEGREAGSEGGHKAAVYIADLLTKYGLEPAGVDRTYFQPFGGGTENGKGQKNVLALRRGSDVKLREEYIVLGAHYDHVGYGRFGSNSGKVGQVHNGADDNASGTSALLEVAEAMAQVRPKRSILFIWFDAEEKGLLGSKEWCARPTAPLDKVIAMLNLDMVGRNEVKDVKVGLEGGATPKYGKLAKLMSEAEKVFQVKFDLEYITQQNLTQRSDHWNFMQVGIPAAFLHGGLHADYHTERDDSEKINYPKEELIARITFWLAMKMSALDGNLK